MILGKVGINAVNGLRGLLGLYASSGIFSGNPFNGGSAGPIFDGIYANYPLINDGDNTISSGSILNLNPNSESVDLTTGTVIVPPYTPAIFPNHDVNGAAVPGLLAQINDQDSAPTSDVFVDYSCFTSNRNSGSYTNGVFIVNDTRAILMLYADNVPSIDGKYEGFQDVLQVNYLLSADNGAMLRINSIGSNNVWDCSILKGSMQEVQEGFEYPNNFAAYFQTSAYDLAGAIALADSIDRTPTVQTGAKLTPSASAPGVSVSGANVSIDGTYSLNDILVRGLIENKDLIQGDYLTIEFNADIIQGSLNAQVGVTQQPIAQGLNRFVTKIGGDVPAGVELPFILAGVTGDVEATLQALSVTVSRWMTYPVNNFDISCEVTYKSLTNIGPAFYLEQTASNYFVYGIADVNGDLNLVVSDNTNSDIITFAGVVSVDQTNVIESFAITDTLISATVDGVTQTTPRTAAVLTGNWDNLLLFGGGSDSVITSKLVIKDSNLSDFANNGDFADNGDFAL